MNPSLIINERVPVEDIGGSGVFYGTILRPVIYTSGNPSNAYECIVDSVGWILLRISPLIAQDNTKSIVIGWSYLISDQAAVKALVDAQAARIGAGADGSLRSNVHVMRADFTEEPFELRCDRAQTAKTIYATLSGTVTGLCLAVRGTKAS